MSVHSCYEPSNWLQFHPLQPLIFWCFAETDSHTARMAWRSNLRAQRENNVWRIIMFKGTPPFQFKDQKLYFFHNQRKVSNFLSCIYLGMLASIPKTHPIIRWTNSGPTTKKSGFHWFPTSRNQRPKSPRTPFWSPQKMNQQIIK